MSITSRRKQMLSDVSSKVVQADSLTGDFDVKGAIASEDEYASNIKTQLFNSNLANRSSLRKAIKSGEQSSGNTQKDKYTVSVSALSDLARQELISQGATIDQLSQYDGKDEEIVDKLRQLDGGKYKGDIDNLLNGKSDTSANKVFDNMFGAGGSISESQQTPMENMLNNINYYMNQNGFTRGVKNFALGLLEEGSKTIGGLITTVGLDKQFSISNLDKISDEDFDIMAQMSGYKGTKEDFINQMKETGVLGKTARESVSEFWEDMPKNVYDPSTTEASLGEFGGEVLEQVVVDELGGLVLSPLKLLKGRKLFDKIYDASKSPFIRGAAAGAEMQAIEDIQEGEASSALDYGVSSLVGGTVSSILNPLMSAVYKGPNELVRNSLEKIDTKAAEDIALQAKNAATTATEETPITKIVKEVFDGVRSREKGKKSLANDIASKGEKLRQIRESLGNVEGMSINDLVNEINKGLEKAGMGGRLEIGEDIVDEVTGEAKKGMVSLVKGSNVRGGDAGLNEIIRDLNSPLSEYNFTKGAENLSLKPIEAVIQKMKALSTKDADTPKETKDLFIKLLYGDEGKGGGLVDKLKSEIGEKGEEYVNLLDGLSKDLALNDMVDGLENMIAGGKTESFIKGSNGKVSTVKEVLQSLEDGGYSEGIIDKLTVAKAAQQFYNAPMSNTDKVIYPSLPGLMEEGIKGLRKAVTVEPVGKVSPGWKQYSKGGIMQKEGVKKAKRAAQSVRTKMSGKVGAAASPRDEEGGKIGKI